MEEKNEFYFNLLNMICVGHLFRQVFGNLGPVPKEMSGLQMQV